MRVWRQPRRGSGGSMDDVDWTAMRAMLAGVDFPATKHQLLVRAKESGCSEAIMETVSGLPNVLYRSAKEVGPWPTPDSGAR